MGAGPEKSCVNYSCWSLVKVQEVLCLLVDLCELKIVFWGYFKSDCVFQTDASSVLLGRDVKMLAN